MALAGLAYLVRDWRKLSIIMAIPAIPFVLGWLWVDIYFFITIFKSIDSDNSPYRDLQQLTTATFFPYDSQHHKRLLLHEMKFNLFIEFIFFFSVLLQSQWDGFLWREKLKKQNKSSTRLPNSTRNQYLKNHYRIVRNSDWETCGTCSRRALWLTKHSYLGIAGKCPLLFFFNQYLALTSDYSLRG